MNFDQWRDVGHYLRNCYRALNWWIGDWLAYGQITYKDYIHGNRLENGVLKAASETLGIDYGTLANWKFVCSAVNSSCRNEKLTFSKAYEIVTGAPDHHLSMWLKRVENEEFTKLSLRKAMREFYAVHPKEANDNGTSSFLEQTRQYVRDFLHNWSSFNDAQRAGYLKELHPILEKFSESC